MPFIFLEAHKHSEKSFREDVIEYLSAIPYEKPLLMQVNRRCRNRFRNPSSIAGGTSGEHFALLRSVKVAAGSGVRQRLSINRGSSIPSEPHGSSGAECQADSGITKGRQAIRYNLQKHRRLEDNRVHELEQAL